MGEYFIGIDVGGTNIKIMIMNPKFEVFDYCSIETNCKSGYDIISDNIIKAIDGMFEAKGVKNKKILSIAMGLPGIVNKKEQETIYLAYLMWNGFNPGKKIGDYYNAPTIIDNDANINTYGEFCFGKFNKVRNMVLLTLGTGVGSGVIINNEIFGGANNLAAELGHMTIVAENGETCLCGQKGHLEAYCSGTALMRYTLKEIKDNPDTILHQYIKENNNEYENNMVVRGVKQNDQLCISIWNRFIFFLSIGIANVMTLFNPELILIGGGISNADKLLTVPVNELTKKMVLHEQQYCRVDKATLGHTAGMYGACALAAHAIGIEPIRKSMV